MRIDLPSIINAEGLLPFLALLGSTPAIESEVSLNFAGLRRVSPAGLAALVATVERWKREQRRVIFDGLNECAILGYLQRMDVLRACSIEFPEHFERHVALGRFVPVQKIIDVDLMSSEVAACLAPDGTDYGHAMSPLYDIAAYVVGELGANVRQHSRGFGFVSAQANKTEGFIRLAVADNGFGVRQSFVDAGLTWSLGLSDSASLRRALEPHISSKGEPVNQGVGLTLVAALAKLTGAWLLIASGDGLLKLSPGGLIEEGIIPNGSRYQGTLIAMTFRSDKLQEFSVLLDSAKQEAGLVVKRSIKSTFT